MYVFYVRNVCNVFYVCVYAYMCVCSVVLRYVMYVCMHVLYVWLYVGALCISVMFVCMYVCTLSYVVYECYAMYVGYARMLCMYARYNVQCMYVVCVC